MIHFETKHYVFTKSVYEYSFTLDVANWVPFCYLNLVKESFEIACNVKAFSCFHLLEPKKYNFYYV